MAESVELVSLLALFVSLASFAYAFFKGRYDQLTAVRPALVFVYEQGAGWVVQNVGNGPAMNIVVAQRDSRTEGEGARWAEPVRIRPLKRDGCFTLHWTAHTNVHALGASYEDMWSRSYTTTCARDLNRIVRGHKLEHWQEDDIAAEWTLRHRPD